VNLARFKSKLESAVDARDEAILEAYLEGTPVREIARQLAMSRRGIYDILRRQGVAFL
jgi:transposase-like protein